VRASRLTAEIDEYNNFLGDKTAGSFQFARDDAVLNPMAIEPSDASCQGRTSGRYQDSNK
jgi:hypothetical protein